MYINNDTIRILKGKQLVAMRPADIEHDAGVIGSGPETYAFEIDCFSCKALPCQPQQCNGEQTPQETQHSPIPHTFRGILAKRLREMQEILLELFGIAFKP